VGISVDLIVCTCTALVVLLTGVLFNNGGATGVAIPQLAFSSVFGRIGDYFLGITLFFFAFTTIVGWYFFAAQNVRYLFGERYIKPYILLVIAIILVASVVQVELVWELADTFNCFLVIPNVIALLYLSPKVVKEVEFMRSKFKAEKEGRVDEDDMIDIEKA
jgi:AGCS family alanine or glycine:cation symporter